MELKGTIDDSKLKSSSAKRQRCALSFGLPSPNYDTVNNSSSSSSESLSVKFLLNSEREPVHLSIGTAESVRHIKEEPPEIEECQEPKEPPKLLKDDYEIYLRSYGILKFISLVLPDRPSNEDIAELILNLRYSKNSIRGYQKKTAREMSEILCRLMMNDKALQGLIYNERLKCRPSLMSFDKFILSLKSAKKILVITGAGISTSVGIPDFRSLKGIYSQLNFLNLSDPQKVFDLKTFKKDPSIFYQVANKILPTKGNFSPSHAFIKLLQDKKKLLRNYTQNIDNLELNVGISPSKLVQCHGSFNTATCITCKKKIEGVDIYDSIKQRKIAYCQICHSRVNDDIKRSKSFGVMKPDITFFGESLPARFFKVQQEDINTCDMAIVIGTSLNVEPVSSIVDLISDSVPKVLINKDIIRTSSFNISLIGYCDDITSYILREMGSPWSIKEQDMDRNIKITCADEDNAIFKIGRS